MAHQAYNELRKYMENLRQWSKTRAKRKNSTLDSSLLGESQSTIVVEAFLNTYLILLAFRPTRTKQRRFYRYFKLAATLSRDRKYLQLYVRGPRSQR